MYWGEQAILCSDLKHWQHGFRMGEICVRPSAHQRYIGVSIDSQPQSVTCNYLALSPSLGMYCLEQGRACPTLLGVQSIPGEMQKLMGSHLMIFTSNVFVMIIKHIHC